ncbi:MAG: Flp pilus assembly protein CpaB [Methylophilus sp.]
MNSTFLRVLAILMVIAAVVTAYVGYRLSQKKPVDTITVVTPTYTNVIARNTLPAGHVLVLEDLETAASPHLDNRSFGDPQSLIGKTITTPILKGAPFHASHFPASSVLGQALAPHERAVAIKVNEVVGVGGFIKPGDHVDVLLYLRSERETGEISSAQVILNDVKVLAYGTLTGESESSQPETLPPSTPAKLGADNKSDIKSSKDSRSAILAVHAQDMAKLMLADSTGSLRLALRGETAAPNGSAVASDQLIRLSEVSHSPGVKAPGLAQMNIDPSQGNTHSKPFSATPKRERVIVHRGDETEVIDVAR